MADIESLDDSITEQNNGRLLRLLRYPVGVNGTLL